MDPVRFLCPTGPARWAWAWAGLLHAVLALADPVDELANELANELTDGPADEPLYGATAAAWAWPGTARVVLGEGPGARRQPGAAPAAQRLDLGLRFKPDMHVAVIASSGLNANAASTWWPGEPDFDWGAQGFSAVRLYPQRPLGRPPQRLLGPGVYARWPVRGGQAVRVDAAVLFVPSDATQSNTVRARMQFQF